MAVLLATYTDPFSQDGLGQASNVGVGFLKKVSINLNAFGTTATILPSDVGASKFYTVVSIVPRSSGFAYLSAFTEASLTVTAAGSSDTFDVFVLAAGL